MGLLRTAIKGGIAKKALDIARRPENQAKAKKMFNSIIGKGGKGRRSTDSVDSTGQR